MFLWELRISLWNQVTRKKNMFDISNHYIVSFFFFDDLTKIRRTGPPQTYTPEDKALSENTHKELRILFQSFN